MLTYLIFQSKFCNLQNLSSEELIKKGEQENEWGGYFVVKGKERLLRMLLLTRKNYPIAVKRSTWKSRDYNFSDIGILIRCCSEDQTSVVNYLKSEFMFYLHEHKNLLD